jgi:hypothetical protein
MQFFHVKIVFPFLLLIAQIIGFLTIGNVQCAPRKQVREHLSLKAMGVYRSANILAQGQSGRSVFSDSSGFPVILTFRSFQLSGRSNCLVIQAILQSFWSIKSKKKLKKKRRVLPIVKEIAY